MQTVNIYMKNFLIKLAIGISSLFLFLGFLEIGLRIVGYCHISTVTKSTTHTLEKKSVQSAISPLEGRTTILCVGDSYTYAGGVEDKEDRYPNLLQARLNTLNSSKQFNVINGGICELTTRGLLKRLPSLIAVNNPDIIILLAGSANMFNLEDYNLKRKKIGRFIINLRIYKMVKIMWLNLNSKIFIWKTSKYIDSKVWNNSAKEVDVEKLHDLSEEYFERVIRRLETPRKIQAYMTR